MLIVEVNLLAMLLALALPDHRPHRLFAAYLHASIRGESRGHQSWTDLVQILMISAGWLSLVSALSPSLDK